MNKKGNKIHHRTRSLSLPHHQTENDKLSSLAFAISDTGDSGREK
jgi:hypothetical protein